MRRLVLLYAFHFLVAADSNVVIPLVSTYTTSYGVWVFEASLIVAASAGRPGTWAARWLAGVVGDRPVFALLALTGIVIASPSCACTCVPAPLCTRNSDR